MNGQAPIRILLADDDKDDCLFFQEALEELQIPATLKTVADGEQLMSYLQIEEKEMPSVLFLDLNMPRKNGFSCLAEIKRSEKWKELPIIIISTSFDKEIADRLYNVGAHHYICKPSDFAELKRVIEKSITHLTNEQPSRANFYIPAKS